MKKLRFLFRVDATSIIGTGHLRECLVFAEQAPIKSHFCIRAHLNSATLVRERKFPCTVIPEKDLGTLSEFKKINQLIDSFKPNVIVTDIIDLKQTYLRKLRTDGKVVVALNAVQYPVKANMHFTTVFRPLPENRQYYGPQYIFLRRQFKSYRPRKVSGKVRNILILFGGSDPCNLTTKALTALAEIPDGFRTNIILGGASLFKTEVEEILEQYHKPYRLYNNISNEKQLISLMRGSDLALVSGGYTMAELMCLGVPCIALSQNRTEEKNIFKNFPQDAFINLGRGDRTPIKVIARVVKNIMKDFERRRLLSRGATKLVDGQGVERVYKLIKQCVLEKHL